MKEDLLNFEVIFFSKDGTTSRVLDFIQELLKHNPILAKKSISNIIDLSLKFYNFDDVKVIKTGKDSFYELRVQSKSDICRFFFVVRDPNYILLYGFSKKTQKTKDSDLAKGIDNLETLNITSKAITFDMKQLQRKF